MIPSLRKIAILLQVSHTTVSRWLKNPDKIKYVRKGTTKLSVTVETIKAAIVNDPFISIIKLKELIWDVLQISVSRELIRIAIKTIGMSRKKARFFSAPSNLGDKTKAFC
jgi:DNA-binding transcriptional regulator YhcF (GntR family)